MPQEKVTLDMSKAQPITPPPGFVLEGAPPVALDMSQARPITPPPGFVLEPPNIFQRLAQEQSGTSSSASPRGNIFQQLAEGTAPATPSESPGFISTIGSDLVGAGKGIVNAASNVLGLGAHQFNLSPAEQAATQARANTEEARKAQVYQNFKANMHGGNYVTALKSLGGLFSDENDDPNDPLKQMVDSQWQSSAQAKGRMMQAAKQGDTLGVIQHAAGIVPIASQVDNAMTKYQAEPTRENLAHVLTSAIPAFIPSMLRGAGTLTKTLTPAAEVAEGTEAATDAASETPVTPTPKPSLVKRLTPKAIDPEAVQPELQGNVRTAAETSAREAGAEVTTPRPSIRTAVEDAGDSVINKSKAQYQELDEASHGRWQRFDDQLRNIRMKMRNVAGIDDDQYDALEDKQNDIETLQSNLIDELKTGGKIDPDLADEAVANYRKGSALQDVDAAVKMSTTGDVTAGADELVNPAKLANRLQKLKDSGRLEQALGKDGAQQLLRQTYAAQQTASKALTYRNVAKWTLRAAGLGTTLELAHIGTKALE